MTSDPANKPTSGRAPGELLWFHADQPRPGPKPTISLDDIVGAAIGLADTSGLAAVSMARVAEQLEVTTMALYRHVSGKQELIEAMVDHSSTEAPPVDETASWRDALEEWATALLHVYELHPWMLEVDLVNIAFGPNRLDWLEAALAALSSTTLDEADKTAIALVLDGVVQTNAQLARRFRAATDGEPGAFASLQYALAPPHASRYPNLIAAEITGNVESNNTVKPGDGAAQFTLGLLFDGIERLIDQPNAANLTHESGRTASHCSPTPTPSNVPPASHGR